MFILNRILDKHGKHRWASWSTFWRSLYYLNAFFSWNLPPGCSGEVRQLFGAECWWVRTPLLCVGYYYRSLLPDRTGLWTGWQIYWRPNLFNLQKGCVMYTRGWDNLKQEFTHMDVIYWINKWTPSSTQ